MNLIEASFDVTRRLAALSAETGEPVFVVDLYAMDHVPDADGECSIWLAINSRHNEGIILVSVAAREVLNLDRSELLAAFLLPSDHITRH